jgi:subtilase family serine protease
MKTRSLVCTIFALSLSASPIYAQSGSARAGLPKTDPENLLSPVTRMKGLKLVTNSAPQPPTDAYCRSNFGFPCYGPQEMQTAYGLAPALSAGYTGAGQTIVIVDSFGSPTIENDLKTFDAGYGLPDPPSFTVLAPLGRVPFNPNNNAHVNWAFETTLDVEWAHAMAPGANIVLLTSPVDETQGTQGLPEFLSLEQYALSHHMGQIISQSWGTTENTLFTPQGFQVMNALENFYQQAAGENITVLTSSGDSGVSNVDASGQPYPYPTVLFPASSPFVTTVGGTTLFADTNGNYQSESVWNNSTGASGGGVSQQFSEPSYQNSLPASVQTSLAGHRGIPDVAYNADGNTPVVIYAGFYPNPKNRGFYVQGGTSAGPPQWAGIIAVANQYAGRPLGFLNPSLYSLAASNLQDMHDIITGNNGFNGIPGYNATPGWDFATGWGTPSASSLIQQLAGLSLKPQ